MLPGLVGVIAALECAKIIMGVETGGKMLIVDGLRGIYKSAKIRNRYRRGFYRELLHGFIKKSINFI